MSEINYRELYENEKRRREEAEQRYNNLWQRVIPLLDSIWDMSEPMARISAVLQVSEKLKKEVEAEPKGSPE